jgi:FkbM family methyltransferase
MDTIANNALADFMPKASNPVLSFVRVPWTVSLLLEWWPKMTISSIFRMRANEIRPLSLGSTVTLKMRNPINGPVTLRSVGSDWSTFEEVVTNEVYAGVAEHVSDCRSIVDLGANIGLTTLYFATKFPKANIVAVEPNPETFQMLQGNLKGRDNVHPIEAAVWSSETRLDGTSEPNRFSAFEVRENSEGTMRGVPIQQIMELAGGSADILKVDIEGAEVELFKGDLNWLQNVRCIAIEFHGNSREVSNFDAIMAEQGFRVIDGKHTVIATRN